MWYWPHKSWHKSFVVSYSSLNRPQAWQRSFTWRQVGSVKNIYLNLEKWVWLVDGLSEYVTDIYRLVYIGIIHSLWDLEKRLWTPVGVTSGVPERVSTSFPICHDHNKRSGNISTTPDSQITRLLHNILCKFNILIRSTERWMYIYFVFINQILNAIDNI